MSLNAMLERTEGRGIFLVIVFLCLPFVVPVSIPGMSTVLGLMVILLSVRLALGRPPSLPGFLGRRALKPATVKRILNASVKVVRLLEKLVKPRRTKWLTWPSAMWVNGWVMAFLAFLMALPLPPVVPFTNSLPSYAIILIALSIMEEDGLTIWLGYVTGVVSVVYLGFIFGGVVPHVVRWLADWGGTAGVGS